MSNRGRPRKLGPRTASGRLSRSKAARQEQARLLKLEAVARATALEERRAMDLVLAQRARLVPPELARDQRAETPLGRLLLHGQIEPAEYAAGTVFAGVAARMRALLGAPPPYVARGEAARPREISLERAQRIRARWATAAGALRDAGKAAARAVQAAAVEERDIGTRWLAALRRGLRALAAALGVVDSSRLTCVAGMK